MSRHSKNQRGSVKEPQWASENYDEDEKSSKYRDKKFEGYSYLKKPTNKKKKQLESKEAGKLQEEYILNLQKQIVLME